MGRAERVELIERIEELRNSKVICYLTSDRPNLNVMISADVVRLIYNHLLELPQGQDTENIDFFIYSTGGHGDVPWKLVPMFREFCKNFSVLIPFKAYSAATLIALGADSIVLGKKAELGPVDPSISSPFHPKDEFKKESAPLKIGVEDITAFVNFIKERVGLTDQAALGSSINLLVEKVGPLALGNLTRFYFHTRMVIEKLLQTHRNKVTDDKIQHISDNLTEKAYFHGHSINRKEARSDYQLKVNYPNQELEDLIWRLYLEYEQELNLLVPFNPEAILQQNNAENFIESGIKLAYIESTIKTDVCAVDYSISRKRQLPVNLNLNINVQIPPGVDPAAIPPQAMQAIQAQLQQSVVNQILSQAPIIGVDVRNIGGGWAEEN